MDYLKETLGKKRPLAEVRRREITEKLKRLRALMRDEGLSAVRLKGVEWFSWITAGGSSVVILTAETGIAEALVTENAFTVLTNRIEASRLRDEELPPEIEVLEFPWDEPEALDLYAQRAGGSGVIACDRPKGSERALGQKFRGLRLKLFPSEIDRYRALGRDAAEAMRVAMSEAEPGWTEYALAGAGARELWARGIHPTLILVAGERRLPAYRHPLPTSEPIGTKAMMVFCGRRHGLYANLTRFVAFRELAAEERRRHDLVAEIEAAAFERSRPGVSTGMVLEQIARAYVTLGEGAEIQNHHQGGVTGYLSREEVAVPASKHPGSIVLEKGMVLAWNPSLPGAKIEDTVLISESGLEVLTEDPEWPRVKIKGLRRPDVWVKT